MPTIATTTLGHFAFAPHPRRGYLGDVVVSFTAHRDVATRHHTPIRTIRRALANCAFGDRALARIVIHRSRRLRLSIRTVDHPDAIAEATRLLQRAAPIAIAATTRHTRRGEQLQLALDADPTETRP